MKRNLLILFLLVILATISACKKEITNIEEKQQATELVKEKKSESETINKEIKTKDEAKERRVEVDLLPSTYKELANRPVGEYSELRYGEVDKLSINELSEMLNDLPDITDHPSEQELDYYYLKLLSKVQREYKGPEEAIRNLRFQSFGDPQLEDSRYQFKENLNVEIILDASGSMAGMVNGKVKMNAAKDAIQQFINKLPDGAKVGLRVYGHKGSGANSDKKLSCESSEIVYPISVKNEEKLQTALGKIKPVGWTPTGLALREAKKDLEPFNGESNTNIVYLVSDGVSTCDDNPVQAAQDLYNSNISPIINVIGFDVDAKGQNQLKEIANITEGIYATVADENELNRELSRLNQVTEMWERWRKKGRENLGYKKTNNSLDIFSYVTHEYIKSTDESWVIGGIMFKLWQGNLISKETYSYIIEKNQTYHNWIRSEIDKLNLELKELNEKSYAEALKSLEDKYEKNTQ